MGEKEDKIIGVILAIIFPTIGVLYKERACNGTVLLNLLLSILLWLPGKFNLR